MTSEALKALGLQVEALKAQVALKAAEGKPKVDDDDDEADEDGDKGGMKHAKKAYKMAGEVHDAIGEAHKHMGNLKDHLARALGAEKTAQVKAWKSVSASPFSGGSNKSSDEKDELLAEASKTIDLAMARISDLMGGAPTGRSFGAGVEFVSVSKTQDAAKSAEVAPSAAELAAMTPEQKASLAFKNAKAKPMNGEAFKFADHRSYAEPRI